MLAARQVRISTDFLLGLTFLHSKSPPGEEQRLPLPSPQSYVMIRCRRSAQAVISLKWLR